MEDYRKIKEELLKCVESQLVSENVLANLHRSSSMQDLICVIKSAFDQFAHVPSFTNFLFSYKSLLSDHNIWVNESVRLSSGDGYLLLTGADSFSVKTLGTAFCHIYCFASSLTEVDSYDHSRLHIRCYCDSNLICTSHESSDLRICGFARSSLLIESCDSSHIAISSYDYVSLVARSYNCSRLSIDTYASSFVRVSSQDLSFLELEHTSGIMATCFCSDSSYQILFGDAISSEVSDSGISRLLSSGQILFGPNVHPVSHIISIGSQTAKTI